MKISDRNSVVVKALAEAETDNFNFLVALSGLRPASDFVGARLAGADFSGADLTWFNFKYADLRRAIWKGRRSDPSSWDYAMRGGGSDNVRGEDFEAFTSVCFARATWPERFTSFRTLVDNWGENNETANVLMEIIRRDKGTYFRLCSALYFFASRNQDEKMKQFCVEMSKAGRSQVNLFRIKKLKKSVREHVGLLERQNLEPRYPGDFGVEQFERLRLILASVLELEQEPRLL